QTRRCSAHRRIELVVVVEDTGDGVESFVLVAPAAEWSQFAAHLFERHALHDHASGAAQRRKEKSFAAEERGLDSADELDVVVDCVIESDDRAGVDLQRFARSEVEFDEIASGMDEDGSRAGELFEDESFASKKSGAEFLDEGDVQLRARLRDQEAIALHE